MSAILTATLVIAAIGAVAALALAVADRYLAVREDPRIGQIASALPGANCGGCGFAGCGDYARALVAGVAAPGARTAADDACKIEHDISDESFEAIKKHITEHMGGN